MESRKLSSDETQTSMAAKVHPHICPYCQVSFRRGEHLQRHIRSHTGEKKYRCPCGSAFSRNDVFVRHMRGCQHGLRDDSWKSADESRSRTKTKRACDECARAKAKCDYQVPCNRCKRKSVKCEKTRKGYEDPYAMYSVPITAKNVAPSGTTDIMIIPDENVEASSASAAPPVLGCTSLEGGGPEQASFTPQPNDDPSAMMLDSPRSPPRDRSLEALDKTPGTFFADCDFATMDPSEMVLQPDPASLYFASMGTLDQLFHPQDLSKGNPSSDFFAPYQTSTPLTGSGFSLSRLDPLEAKCNELN